MLTAERLFEMKRLKLARLRHYFSFRSPYSWLAFRDLREDHADLLTRLTWIPYWDPEETILARLRAAGGEYNYVAMSKQKHRYMLQDVRRQTTRRGLPVTWPMDSGVRWEVAHVGYFAAAEQGHGLEYVDRVFRARWCEGRAIDDPAVIADIAGELGLDGPEVAAAADQPRYQDKAIEALLAAYQDDVFGPPLFVAGRAQYWGLDRLAEFIDVVRAQTPVPEPISEDQIPHQPVGADISHAGGCG